MRYATLFGRTSKNAPHDADCVNAKLLTQAGFIDRVMAGVYTFLPLGYRVLGKIKDIVREEMDRIGGQEMLMPALHPKDLWAATGRWSDPGPEVMFQFEGRGGSEMGLGWTHEEVIAQAAAKTINSYRDLPLAVYQIQDKFRSEPRAKSGLLRGREFSMKDLYSFHATPECLESFYAKATEAYLAVFRRCGLDALVTEASGGAFSKYSHEFQVLCETGEDHVFLCPDCKHAQNREIAESKAGDTCKTCGKGTIEERRAIEVGNIFKLGTRFSEALGCRFTDADGTAKAPLMGCYGIGPSRVMGTAVEVHHDDKGIRWPAAIAPFDVHLLTLGKEDDVRKAAEELERVLATSGVDVLFDDRDASAGEKFADADLIGIPHRMVVSGRSLKAGGVEWKRRDTDAAKILKPSEAPGALR